MFNQLTSIGLGLVTFAIVVGVGTVVLYTMAGNMGCNPNSLVSGAFNKTSGTCSNSTGNTAPTGAGYTATHYLEGQMGTGGLTGWVPVIIVFIVGMFFLGSFIGGGKKSRKV